MAKVDFRRMEKFCSEPVGKTISIDITGRGKLFARRAVDCTRYYYQYNFEGKLKRYPFGVHDRDGDSHGGEATQYNLNGAKLRAEELSKLQATVGDLIGYMREQQQANAEAVQHRRKAREVREAEAREYSLARLCEAYSEHLRTEGKASASTVRNALNRWVIDRHPAIAAKKASDVTTDDIMVILRSIIEEGHRTMTNRLRSYLSAAYGFGIGSALDPLSNSKAQGFRLTHNPVAAIKPVGQFEAAGERALSKDELAEFLRRLRAKNTPATKAVLLALRLGGQRVTQLLAVSPDRITDDTITLIDSKGRRQKPRKHVLPVPEAAQLLLDEAGALQHPTRPGLWSGLVIDTVSKAVSDISRGMVADGVAEPFTLRDLRRTCETRLAAMGVSKDLRARILSHGLSGIQEKHYDRHDYLDEMRKPLDAWNDLLDGLISGEQLSGNVSELADHRKAKSEAASQ